MRTINIVIVKRELFLSKEWGRGLYDSQEEWREVDGDG